MAAAEPFLLALPTSYMAEATLSHINKPEEQIKPAEPW